MKKKESAFLKYVNEKVPEGTNLDASAPDQTLQLEHVHGFGGVSMKNAGFFGKTNNDFVFPTAAVGVVYDLTTKEQRFFGGNEVDKLAEKYEKTKEYH